MIDHALLRRALRELERRLKIVTRRIAKLKAAGA
jgi:hypothetical protein